jgi:predicted signal transduction protein with EAL and GGDEF domain
MMVQADLALYGAKDEGRNCYRFHSLDLDQQVHERVTIAEEMRLALEGGDLELYYQPQVELATGRIIGVEALIR